MTTDKQYRAYDKIADRMVGPVRTSESAARADAEAYEDAIAKQNRNALSRAIIVTRDPDAPSRCVDAETNETVWPQHGRSCGAVRFDD